jgi:hypothetical protein
MWTNQNVHLPDLRFHLKEIDDPHESWEKIESVFGKLNIIRAQ